MTNDLKQAEREMQEDSDRGMQMLAWVILLAVVVGAYLIWRLL